MRKNHWLRGIAATYGVLSMLCLTRAQAELKPGDVLTQPDGRFVEITGIHSRDARTRVWNLEVQDLHSYYVKTGDANVLVHNSLFIGTPNGPPYVVPEGASGPVDVVNGAGKVTGQGYVGGSGGPGLDPRVDTLRAPNRMKGRVS